MDADAHRCRNAPAHGTDWLQARPDVLLSRRNNGMATLLRQSGAGSGSHGVSTGKAALHREDVLNPSKLIRQFHRWLLMIFTLRVVATLEGMTSEAQPACIVFSPLPPIF